MLCVLQQAVVRVEQLWVAVVRLLRCLVLLWWLKHAARETHTLVWEGRVLLCMAG